jgi:predicted ArsR family transcriptional regulator
MKEQKKQLQTQRRQEFLSFLKERDALSLSALAREAEISHSTIKLVKLEKLAMTERVWVKLLPIMQKYGYLGAKIK